jgi:hypothetical protein
LKPVWGPRGKLARPYLKEQARCGDTYLYLNYTGGGGRRVMV